MDEFFMHSTMKAVQRMVSAWRRFFFRFSVFSGCNNFALRHFELSGPRLAMRHAPSHLAARTVSRFA
ncbi:hypothetical protein [Massilia sp. BSC265]|uniref:hypothetical protein n=1 Tax=Massilia sp. BSC265 TaxID=1549812 RepID=UPI000AAED2FF|nr:hypothetical protein [Massilia sp. BSC265]